MKSFKFMYLTMFLLLTNIGFAADEITNFSAPTEVTLGETITVTVSYDVSEEREIVTGIQQNHSPWDGWSWTSINVPAGTGTVNLSVTIPNNLTLGNGYQIPIVLQPVGGNWNTRLDNKSVNPVSVNKNIPVDPDFIQCGLFPSALNTWGTINRGNGNIVLDADSVYANGVIGTGNQNIECVFQGAVNDCLIKPMPKSPPTLPSFIDSPTSGSYTAIGNESNESYGDITVNSDVTFSPSGTYANGKPVMMMHSLTINNGATVTFEAGDYWIDAFRANASTIIRTTGKVRLFINSKLTLTENHLDINYDNGGALPGNLFIFVYGDFEFASNDAGNIQDMTAYVYVNGTYTANMYDANSHFKGAITAVHDINLNNNQEHIYDDSGLIDGWGACCIFVQWQNNEYQILEDFENPMPPTKIVNTVIALPDGPLAYDVTVTYTTVDGTAIAGDDYVHVSNTATIPAGDSNFTVPISIYNDPDIELDEHFFVQLSNPQPAGICLNEYNRTKITILAQENSPICFEDTFDNPLDSLWRVLTNPNATNTYIPQVVNVNGDGRLRLTDRQHNLATTLTKDFTFQTQLNLIIVEFDYYNYGGCADGSNYHEGNMGDWGADGIVNVLFNSEKPDGTPLDSPTPGATGGSMGYAQIHTWDGRDIHGFEGGWLGLGLDEFGNFARANEGKDGGITSNDQTINAVSIRGDGVAMAGYEYLAGTTTLTPPLANELGTSYSADGYYSGRFKFTVDARDPAHLYIKLERDIDGNESNTYGWETIIDQFDAKNAGQGATPDKVRYAITSGSGGGCNNHELSWIQLRGNCEVYSTENNYISGPFIALDTFRWRGNAPIDSNDKAISTKDVNRNFNLIIASMNAAGDGAEAKEGIDVKYGIYSTARSSADCAGDLFCLRSGPLRDFNVSAASDGAYIRQNFNIGEAYAEAHVRIFYCGDHNSTSNVTSLYPYSDCASVALTDAQPEQTAGHHLFYYESNHFAVKPSNFTIEDKSAGQYIAGSDFNITFNAIDINSNDTNNFNETAGGTFDVNITEQTPGCVVGGFTPNITSGWGFTDGRHRLETNYNEVGVIDINISDIHRSCSERFARIDCNDKNISGSWNTDTNSYIGQAMTTMNFIPSYFAISSTLTDHKPMQFTYLSSDLNMSATLDLNITAKAATDTTTANYNSLCYAQSINTSIDIFYPAGPTTPNTLRGIVYLLEAEGTTFSEKKNHAAINQITNIPDNTIFPAGDHNGTAEVKIKINFDRRMNEVVNPFYMQISDINISDNNYGGTIVQDEPGTNAPIPGPNNTATFHYGRAKSSSVNDYYQSAVSPVRTPITILAYCDWVPGTSCTLMNIDTSSPIIGNQWWTSTEHSMLKQDGNITLQTVTPIGGWNVTAAVNIEPTAIPGIDRNIWVTNVNQPVPVVLDIGLDTTTPTTTSSWLIHNSTGVAVPNPFYQVEILDVSGWAGSGATGLVTDIDSSAADTNRLSW